MYHTCILFLCFSLLALFEIHTNRHSRIHTVIHIHLHTHTHAHTHMHARVCAHTHTRAHTHKHTHKHTHTHTHTQTHTCTHTHTCAQTLTQTHTCSRAHTYVMRMVWKVVSESMRMQNRNKAAIINTHTQRKQPSHLLKASELPVFRGHRCRKEVMTRPIHAYQQ